MLILDKQKAVERVVALTSALAHMSAPGDPAEAPPVHPRVRLYRRAATHERRVVERWRRRLIAGSSLPRDRDAVGR